MRLAIIADIHGNGQALDAVLEDIETRDIDAVISLGDTIGYGPEPDRVVRTLISRQIPSVQGNHELALSDDRYFRILNPISQQSLTLTRQLLAPESLSWLAALPEVILRFNSRFLHGCPPASPTEYLYDPSPVRLCRIFSSYPEQLCFAGHTHVLNMFTCTAQGAVKARNVATEIITLDGSCRYLFICGSVGQPRDELDNRAKYGIWDDERQTLEIRAVTYDVATTVRLLTEHGFPEVNARRLL